jgi:hypothetical protein
VSLLAASAPQHGMTQNSSKFSDTSKYVKKKQIFTVKPSKQTGNTLSNDVFPQSFLKQRFLYIRFCL